MARRVKVDVPELVAAFETNSPEMEHFLDLQTGQVVTVTEDDQRAISDFEEEVEIQEDEDPKAKFEAWLEDYDCPDWQVDSIRDAFLVETEFGARFIRVPKQESREGYSDMSDFAETVQDERLRDLLSVALNGKGAFRRFKDVLCDYPEERERWFKYEEQQATKRVLDWLESEDIEVEQ